MDAGNPDHPFELRLSVNGRALSEGAADPHTTLLSFLRARGLTGAKEGCAEGECGACAVALLEAAPDGKSRYRAVNACLLPLPALHGREVVTVEGVGGPDALHPVQAAFADGAFQCGYCTPGFVVSAYAEYHRAGRTGLSEEALHGNLCRCTGYRPIRDALREAGTLPAAPPPPRLARPAPALERFAYRGGERAFIRPDSLDDLLAELHAHPHAKIIAGGTDVMVEANLRAARWDILLSVEAVPELHVLNETADALEIGAAVPLARLEAELAGRAPLLDALWPLFASPLVRGRATLGGNLCSASPVGDAAPCLLALNAVARLAGPDGGRELPLADFFAGYRKSALKPGELLVSVVLPLPLPAVQRFYKVAKRGRDDISTVALAAALDVAPDGTVSSVRLGLGGVAATPARAPRTEAFLSGQPFTAEVARAAGHVLAAEFTPLSDQRGSAAYRSGVLALAISRLYADLNARVPA